MKTTEEIIRNNVKLDTTLCRYKIVNKNDKWFSEEEIMKAIGSIKIMRGITPEYTIIDKAINIERKRILEELFGEQE